MPSATGFWIGNESGHYDDPGLCRALFGLFTGCSVLDLGCGNGYYLQEFRRAGIVCQGVDGNPDTQHGRVFDLAFPQDLGEWDWILSLEVGEHIPAEFEEVYLGNLVRHAGKGVVLSWAVPGQEGHGHVNCHSNDWVLEQMAARGFWSDLGMTLLLRRAATLPWFPHTLMVFRRP